MRTLPRSSIVLALAVCAACIPIRPEIPEGWSQLPSAQVERTIEERPDDQGRLWILIGYRSFLGHAALMVFGPGHDEVVFWDPAGGYGRKEKDFDRNNDVVVDDEVPDLYTYMNHRFNEAAGFESALAVLEWEIDLEHAAEMRATLLSGYEADNSKDAEYDTQVGGLRCSIAMCDFLRKHGHETVDVEKTYAYPHKLLNDLMEHHPPQRVIVFEWDREARVYQPGEGDPIPSFTTAGEPSSSISFSSEF